MTHGTRAIYRAGCRCSHCRAANAAYWQSWHLATLKGRPLLGARVSAVEAHRLLKIMRAEWLTKRRLAVALGIRFKDLARLSHRHTISVRMLLKIRRLYRRFMLEGDPATGRPVETVKTIPHGLEN